jgi:hypothetical protein
MEEKLDIEGLKKLTLMFDALLVQTIKKGITYEEYLEINSNEEFYGEFQQLNSWNQQYGYTFNVYNDHLINDKKHFHFENKEKMVHFKMDFDGNILEKVGKNDIDSGVHKKLRKFLKQESVVIEWNKLWDKNNKE